MVYMKKSSELKLRIVCLSTSAYGLVVSLNQNRKLCPANVRSAIDGVIRALDQKHVELMFESSCKLIKAMDASFVKKSSIYKAKGYDGDIVWDWYLKVKMFLVLLKQIDDKDTKEWLETKEGKEILKFVEIRVIMLAEQMVEEEEDNA